jgi:hypothetical protein
MVLPKRFTTTPKNEPIPVNKNTGATASRIAADTCSVSDGVLKIIMLENMIDSLL